MYSTISPLAAKPSGIGVRKSKIRQAHRPVGKLKPQTIPAFAAPAFGDPVPLQHEMRTAALLEPMAHHQPGLAAADDEGLDMFSRHGDDPGEVFAARGGLRRRADDPAPERGEIALFGLKTAIDQIPAHALRHRQGKRRDQPSGGEIVVDIGPDAHGNAEPVGGGLQRLAVILKLRPARGDAGDAGGLEP